MYYRREDTRNRKDRLHRASLAWQHILPDLVHSYLCWDSKNNSQSMTDSELEEHTVEDARVFRVEMVDLFGRVTKLYQCELR